MITTVLGNTVRNKPYPDLLKRCLTNWLYGEHELVPVSPKGLVTPDQFGTLAAQGMRLAKQNDVDPHERSGGYRQSPAAARKMVTQSLQRGSNQPCRGSVTFH